jgi:hypothetical protein
MRRLFAILLLAAAGLFAACTDPAASPGAPDVTTAPLPTDALPTESVEPSVEPTVEP